MQHPDVWGLPGGQVQANETLREALVRELREELAIEVAQPEGECLSRVERDGVEMCVWLINEWVGEPFNAAPEEHDGIGWFTVDDALNLSLVDPDWPSLISRALRQCASD